ncbi:Chromosome transmission fidelity protein 8 [Schistosoma japonicum]|nr:Chromosome transmission fidelity protein 8 [Schistosoma japonicum]
MNDPIYLIDHHVLHGKVVAFEKTMLVTRKNTTPGSSVSYDIVSVVRRKLIVHQDYSFCFNQTSQILHRSLRIRAHKNAVE